MSLKKSFFWSFASNIVPQLVNPIVIIFLARFLVPEDYGIFALAMVIITFAQLFKDAGLGQVIIQSKDKGIANFVFTIQLLLGILLYLIIYLLSAQVSVMYNTREIENVIKVLGLIFVIAPFIDIPVYLSIKEIRFKAVFVRYSISPILSGAISIILAINNYGYWALVYGQLFGNLFTAIIFLIYVRWYPKLNFEFKKYKNSFSFGIHIFTQGIFTWIMGSADKLFLGKYQSKECVGYYEMAGRAANIPFSALSVPINKLMYPVMRKEVSREKKISKLYLTVTKRILLISLPFSLLIYLKSDSIFKIVLGEKWIASSELFRYLVIMMFTSTVVSLNIEVYKSIGRTNIMTKFLAIRSLVSIPIYFYAAQKGVLELAQSRALLALIFSPINSLIVLNVLKIKLIEFLKLFKSPLIIAIIYLILWYGISVIRLNIYFDLILNIIFFIILFITSIYFFDRKLLKLKA